MKSLYFVLVLCLCQMEQTTSSAIPMWEFLSKQEKMSYLYSMFANQVDDFCDNSSMRNCNKALLKYGLGKLKEMPEDHLDTMDPYQRGAGTIIWDSMMEGHEMKGPARPRFTTTTTKPNSYEDASFGDYDVSASAKIDNVFKVAPPKGFVYTIQTGTPQFAYPSYHREKAGAYTRFQQQYTTAKPGPPSEGALLVKVYPDGRPVTETASQLPQDEDLRQYHMSKAEIPNL